MVDGFTRSHSGQEGLSAQPPFALCGDMRPPVLQLPFHARITFSKAELIDQPAACLGGLLIRSVEVRRLRLLSFAPNTIFGKQSLSFLLDGPSCPRAPLCGHWKAFRTILQGQAVYPKTVRRMATLLRGAGTE